MKLPVERWLQNYQNHFEFGSRNQYNSLDPIWTPLICAAIYNGSYERESVPDSHRPFLGSSAGPDEWAYPLCVYVLKIANKQMFLLVF